MEELRFSDAGRLFHAYIVSAPSREECLRRARTLAAAAVCTGAGPVPCGKCRACRKAESGIHPDITTIRRQTDDKGKQRRDITVDQVCWMIGDAYVLPNEAERKVYIIEEAETMNPSAQNKALKLLEEPPKGVIFLLCTTNPEQLLPTVRSRCAELKGNAGKAERDEEADKLAAAYVKAVSGGDRAKLLRWCTENEGLDNRSTAAFVDRAQELLADMLCGRKSRSGLTEEKLAGMIRLMERCGSYLKVNTGIKHIFGLLAVDSPLGSGNRGKDN